jgi:hypothetical protein
MVAVFYVFISSRVVRQPVVDARALRVFAGTAAGFLLLATPYLLSGPTITLVWCAQTVFLAWACTRERLGFLRLHVLAMVGVIAVRLVGFDGLFEVAPVDSARAYLPFMQLESYPPLAAALTFGVVGHFLGRLPRLSQAVTGLLGLGLLVLTFGVHGESVRWTRAALAPNASRELQNLIESGLLVSVMCALWFALVARLTGPRIPAALGAGFGALLLLWVVDVLFWPGGYGHMSRILGHGYSLWWLHTGVLLMAPLVWLLAQLGRGIDKPLGWLKLSHLRAAFFGAALIVTLLLLRREIFAITHAPPVADFFSADARLASYRMLLSLAYAFLAFGIYLNAIRAQSRARLHAAYALYVMTALKVYIFDLESQNQLYRAFSLLIFAAILFVSSYFANRHRAANPISHA